MKLSDEATKINLKYSTEFAKDLFGEVTMEKYQSGYARRGTLIAQLQQFLQQYPLLITPISATQAFEQDADIESIESNAFVTNAQWSMLAIPLLGFPALSMPVHVEDGLPTGIQIIGIRFREDTILELAEVLEAYNEVQTSIDPKF